MNWNRDEVLSLMTDLSFPEDAKEVFLETLIRIENDEVSKIFFSEILSRYEENENCDYRQMMDDAEKVGDRLGIHKYTVWMVMYLCMAKKLFERYKSRGLSKSLYHHTLMDLRYKLEECRLVYGIQGAFAAFWFRKFFDLTRFALGRLQFEMVETKEDYELEGKKIPAGSKAINVHIPRTGTRLDHSQVQSSYAMAACWFRDEFPNGSVLFICNSYLLDPWMQTVLSSSSNLSRFCADYEIVKSGTYDGYGEAWRLFDCQYTGNPADLPRDSSLRRAYADRIARGEAIGWGIGLFRYEPKEEC